MSRPPALAVTGSRRALTLAGPPGPAVVTGAPHLHLADPGEPSPPNADAIWLPGSREALTQPSPALSGLSAVIATGGEGLWSRAPWPAADALFELPPPPAPLALVAGGDEERRAYVADRLAERGLSVRSAELLTADDLAAASVVALLGDAGAATPEAPWTARATPAEAPAVLAARRVLIAPRCAATFGLLAGTDHLAFATGDEVIQYADAVLTFPDSFEPFRALGARTAEPHRASRVYARLAAELGEAASA